MDPRRCARMGKDRWGGQQFQSSGSYSRWRVEGWLRLTCGLRERRAEPLPESLAQKRREAVGKGLGFYIFELATRLQVKRQLILRRNCVPDRTWSFRHRSPVCVSLASACE